MENKKQSSLKEISELESPYFELQASWGITKHMGGLKATRELVELCHINEGKYVLDVGCGVGITPCYLVRSRDCRVVGVDISERMIDWSNKRARREGVEDRVEFRVADAQALPFEDTLFDVVICESVVIAVQDKQSAVSEFVRVTKPAGYVGLTETTWGKTLPPAGMIKYLSRLQTEALTADGWEELLADCGLRDIVVRAYEVNRFSEAINRFKRYGLKELLGASYRTLALYIKSPAFRNFLKEAGSPPKNIFEYMGYGIYVGRK